MGGTGRRVAEYGVLVFLVFFVLEKFSVFFLFCFSMTMVGDFCARTAT
jgi:hypothetical protein